MGRSSTRAWVAGGVLLALLVAAGGWFLLVAPVVDDGATARADAAAERDRRDLLQVQVAHLKTQHARLGELQAELAHLEVEVPPVADQSGLARQLDAHAAAAGVTVLAVTMAPATPALDVELLNAAQASGEDGEDADAADGTGEAADDGSVDGVSDEGASDGTVSDGAVSDGSAEQATGTPVASNPVLAGLYAVQVQVTVLGTYDQVLAFLRAVQAGDQRLMLVHGLDATAQEQQEATPERPATAPGDLEVTVTGQVYVLPDGTLAAVEEPAPPPLPVPGGQRNPFLPVGS